MGSAWHCLASQHSAGLGWILPLGCQEVRFLAGTEVYVLQGEHEPRSPHTEGWGRTKSLRPKQADCKAKDAHPWKYSPAAGGSISLIYSNFPGPQVWIESICSLFEKLFSPLQRNAQHLHKFRQCPEGSRIRENALTTNPSISSGKNQFLCACSCGDYC